MDKTGLDGATIIALEGRAEWLPKPLEWLFNIGVFESQPAKVWENLCLTSTPKAPTSSFHSTACTFVVLEILEKHVLFHFLDSLSPLTICGLFIKVGVLLRIPPYARTLLLFPR